MNNLFRPWETLKRDYILSHKRPFMTQYEDNSLKHPYSDYENTSLWMVVDKSVSVLEKTKI